MKKFFFIFFLVLIFSGCTNVPKEAPELSIKLGEKVENLRVAHINLLHQYFDMKRDAVNKFIETEWIPKFANEFFSDPKIEKVWQKIVEENDKKQRLDFILETSPVLQRKILQKREEMLKPLNDMEEFVRNNLENEYREANAINGSLTSYLNSAYKVDQNKKYFFDKANINDDKISKILDSVEKTTNSLTDINEKLKSTEEKTEEFKKKLNDLKGDK